MIGEEVKLLDHGYIKLVEFYGSDEMVIRSARMSTQKPFLGWGTPEQPGDEKLLRYLYENNHATPFEMAGCIFELRAPIMVFREWHRHRTQSYNESSARYAKLANENYVPGFDDLKARTQTGLSTKNRQAAGMTNAMPSDDQLNEWLRRLIVAYDAAEDAYAYGLEIGVPKELARLSTPVARYSSMMASTNLRNWLGFVRLRSAPQAQKEIRVYSNAVHAFLTKLFPRTMSIVTEDLGFNFSERL